MKLVAGHRQQVDIHCFDINRPVAHRLHCVGMEINPSFAGDGADFGNRLHRADFIVGKHNADQNRIRTNRRFQSFHIHPAKFINRQDCQVEPFFLQRLARLQHRVVLDRRSDDVLAAVTIGVGDSFDGNVIALRAAGSKENLVRLRTNQLCHLFAGNVNRFPRLSAKSMNTARIAECVRHIFEHSRCNILVGLRCRRVVKINLFHTSLSPLSFSFIPDPSLQSEANEMESSVSLMLSPIFCQILRRMQSQVLSQ